jgi:hypothetical protein
VLSPGSRRGLEHSEAVQVLIERKKPIFINLTLLSPYLQYPEDFLKKGSSNCSESKTLGGASIGGAISY